jgi:glycosyltransferase involved in cell wall biosynthesis
MPSDSRITVVVPVYNEGDVLEIFQRRLVAVLDECDYSYDILYVDDGSDGECRRRLQALRDAHPGVGILQLSRNFGKEVAVSAGLEQASGDAVVVIDADLQDPPELIPEFLRQWQAGYDVVYGQRSSRRGDSAFKRWSAGAFYRLLNALSEVHIPPDVGDYRLLSRRAVDAINTLPERHRYMKGLYAWIGFPQAGVPYARAPRAGGESKWNYWRLWNFALEGITSFSDAPLRIATYLGLAASTVAFLYGVVMIVRTLIWGNPVPGYPSLMVVILFLGGVQLVCLGIIGEYLSRTYHESKGRALYFTNAYLPPRTLADADDD